VAESLKGQLLASAPTPAAAPLLDMTAVEHIDGCALQVLLAWSEGLKPAKVRIHAAAPPIQQWIRIAGVCDLFEFSDTNN
jgi:anti-anti-sigma regulatory factor